jgi:hypothetical protein
MKKINLLATMTIATVLTHGAATSNFAQQQQTLNPQTAPAASVEERRTDLEKKIALYEETLNDLKEMKTRVASYGEEGVGNAEKARTFALLSNVRDMLDASMKMLDVATEGKTRRAGLYSFARDVIDSFKNGTLDKDAGKLFDKAVTTGAATLSKTIEKNPAREELFKEEKLNLDALEASGHAVGAVLADTEVLAGDEGKKYEVAQETSEMVVSFAKFMELKGKPLEVLETISRGIGLVNTIHELDEKMEKNFEGATESGELADSVREQSDSAQERIAKQIESVEAKLQAERQRLETLNNSDAPAQGPELSQGSLLGIEQTDDREETGTDEQAGIPDGSDIRSEDTSASESGETPTVDNKTSDSAEANQVEQPAVTPVENTAAPEETEVAPAQTSGTASDGRADEASASDDDASDVTSTTAEEDSQTGAVEDVAPVENAPDAVTTQEPASTTAIDSDESDSASAGEANDSAQQPAPVIEPDAVEETSPVEASPAIADPAPATEDSASTAVDSGEVNDNTSPPDVEPADEQPVANTAEETESAPVEPDSSTDRELTVTVTTEPASDGSSQPAQSSEDVVPATEEPDRSYSDPEPSEMSSPEEQSGPGDVSDEQAQEALHEAQQILDEAGSSGDAEVQQAIERAEEMVNLAASEMNNSDSSLEDSGTTMTDDSAASTPSADSSDDANDEPAYQLVPDNDDDSMDESNPSDSGPGDSSDEIDPRAF